MTLVFSRRGISGASALASSDGPVLLVIQPGKSLGLGSLADLLVV